MISLAFELPLRLRGGLNAREHWRVRAKRAKAERNLVKLFGPNRTAWAAVTAARRLRISLTRVAPKRVDSDNLQGLLKHVRDEVAAKLGVDDGSEALEWLYFQESEGKRYAVRVQVLSAPEATP